MFHGLADSLAVSRLDPLRRPADHQNRSNHPAEKIKNDRQCANDDNDDDDDSDDNDDDDDKKKEMLQ